MVGAKHQPDLYSTLLRFRLHKVALSGDIAKMYRQIALADEDKDFHRILWRDSPSEPLKHLRMTRVTYGIASSSFHSIRFLQEVGKKSTDEEVQLAIFNDFYVDDFIGGAPDKDTASSLVHQLIAALKKHGFELRKWTSSDSSITLSPPEKLRETEESSKILDEDYHIKTLGIRWNPNPDTFTFNVTLDAIKQHTKRTLLSDVSKLFDPSGWLGPVIIRYKGLLQKLWILGIDWDSELPFDIKEEWLSARTSLKQLEGFHIPRCVLPDGEIEDFQLHLFTDASEKAYSANVYSRIKSKDGSVSTRLLVAKTRVAPVKTVSLPRLELCGAQLGTKLMSIVIESLQSSKLTINSTHAWTDSTIVLQWLNQLPRTWTTFVANRVSEIQESMPRAKWNHIPSQQSPADLSSRGMEVKDFIASNLWWQGPEFLGVNENQWPKQPMLSGTPPEIRSKESDMKQTIGVVDTENHSSDFIPIECYSSFNKLLRIMATVHVASQHMRKHKRSNFITVSDLSRAKNGIIRCHQIAYYTKERRLLQNDMPSPKDSKILNLTPFYDEETGTLRVGGRLSQGQFRESKKFPFLIAKDSRLAFLILQHFHEATLHGGGLLTLNASREEYWVPGGRELIKKIIKQCVKCSRFENKVPYQLMADLPAERITVAKPFQKTGHFAGPISTKTSPKTYIACFVCFVVKAVHIELVGDLTKEACIAAIKRFTARRGLPEKIFSDNGRNFIGARNDILKVQELLSLDCSNESLGRFVTHEGIEWETIPPRAPHFGGLWEASVKSLKRHLRKTVGLQILSFEELNTVVTQIESILNSRPLAAMSNDPNDLQSITPAHFLLGRAASDIPNMTNNMDKNISLSQRFKLLERIKRSFWKSWHRDYLVTLQVRKRWLHSGPKFSEGDLVLIAEDNLPPLKWQLARIEKLYCGNDEINRVAKLKVGTGFLIRPIVKLRKLPVESMH